MIKIEQSTAADVEACQDMINEAGDDTGLPESWKECTTDALVERNVFLAWDDGVPVGYFAFLTCILPDTKEFVMIERMLYVCKSHRGGTTAMRLVAFAENYAKEWKCDAVLAGSSLHENALARKLYEKRGYKTNFTFRKDI